MFKIVEGVRYIYSMYMVYCDFKFGNVFVNVEIDFLSKLLRVCLVKIIDFGLIKIKKVSKIYID